MSRPVRIQRQRTAGWRMPSGAVYVGRPSVYGNPFTGADAADDFRTWITRPMNSSFPAVAVEERHRLVTALPRLVGRDLACWCPPGQPCHGDVLLNLVNDAAALDDLLRLVAA